MMMLIISERKILLNFKSNQNWILVQKMIKFHCGKRTMKNAPKQ